MPATNVATSTPSSPLLSAHRMFSSLPVVSRLASGDLVKERLAAAGVRLDLWRVRVQPGKPFLYGLRADENRWQRHPRFRPAPATRFPRS